MIQQPTQEQIDIISEPSNCMVVAQPGSGKTYTLSIKIKNILSTLAEHKGIIAISFTNKASEELESRCLQDKSQNRNSIFCTIDKFLINEIIRPFGCHLFGNPRKEINIVKRDENNFDQNVLVHLNNILPLNKIRILNTEQISEIRELYLSGKIILDLVGILATYILKNSIACQRYIKARYTHIIIDEYQDSDEHQHEVFLQINRLGVIAIAVGDANQSIFRFTGKDPRYLLSLAKENFKTYPLSKNHRSHQSIIDYSTRLLSPSYQISNSDENHVFHTKINGSQIEITQWISRVLDRFMKKYDVKYPRNVAILVSNKHTGKIVHDNLGVKHKLYLTTPIDEDSSLWGGIFKKTLELLFNEDIQKYDLIERYLNTDLNKRKVRSILESLRNLDEIKPSELTNYVSEFCNIASNIFPNAYNDHSIKTLKEVLDSEILMNSFKNAQNDEVQVMTLHKSKGLEFDLVFHLDLYEWILPSKKSEQGRYVYPNEYQDLNLHYVGITRAKKAIVMCTSTHRYNSSAEVKLAKSSEFLYRHSLETIRVNF